MTHEELQDQSRQERGVRMGGDLRIQDSRMRKDARSSAVHFEEVARPLRLFAQALSGKRFVVKPLRESPEGHGVTIGVPRHANSETIYLPRVCGRFSTAFMNFLAFKLATAHQAGYAEFGTYTFRLSCVYDLFPPDLVLAGLKSICDEGTPASALEVFFRLFPNREIARDLFHLLEDARIDHSLRREYRGLKKDMDDFLRAALEDRQPIVGIPLQEAMVEHILRITAGGETGGAIPRSLLSHLEYLPSLISPLLERGATVEDSARTAVILYGLISPLPNILPDALPPESQAGRCQPLSGLPFDGKETDFALRADAGGAPYQRLTPLPHRGHLGPEHRQHRWSPREIRPILEGKGKGVSLSTEELRELLENGIKVDVQILGGDEQKDLPRLSFRGAKDLPGLSGRRAGTNEESAEETTETAQTLRPESAEEVEQGAYYYDEWDYQLNDYRVSWCRMKEKHLKLGCSDFVAKTLEAYAGLVADVRRQFKMLRPELFKKIPQLERGEEIDLNAAIEASVDRQAGLSPSEKIYIERERKERDFSTLFLLDMSASTNDRVDGKTGTGTVLPLPAGKTIINPRFYDPEYVLPSASSEPEGKRVIDIEKEALVVMAEALKEIGDDYAMYGFSSYGRKEVEFFAIKDFDEAYDEDVKKRIDGIEPQRSTRMGTAIRHALTKIAGRRAKTKNIILISDGYPQDHDYGEDRAGTEYGLQDTKMAIQEAARRNTQLFCLTVDLVGNDYLRKMCHDSQYLVIEETDELPRVLPKIYRRLTT